MTDYLSDDEQADRVKGWLRENGLFLIGGLVLGIGGLFGWNQWQGWKQNQAEQASAIWEQLLGYTSRQQVAEAEAALRRLESDYSGSGYLDLARLTLAGMHMTRNAPELAAAALEAVVNGRGDEQLRHVARLRLARVQAYTGNHEAALALLASVDGGAFAARYHEVRGDIHAERGALDEARREYESALAIDQRGLIDRPYVQAKLDELRVAGPEELVRAQPLGLPGLFD